MVSINHKKIDETMISKMCSFLIESYFNNNVTTDVELNSNFHIQHQSHLLFTHSFGPISMRKIGANKFNKGARFK